jgi:hypothetical protein
MKPYSVDCEKNSSKQEQKVSIRTTAAIFAVSKSLIQMLVNNKNRGSVQPKPRENPGIFI